MCYLCLADQFGFVAPKSTLDKTKDRALEIKALLKLSETNDPCNEGNKLIESLKEEQYKLSREM